MKNKKVLAFFLAAAIGMGALSISSFSSKITPNVNLETSMMTAQAASTPSASKLAAAVKKAYGDSYAPDYKLGKDEVATRYGVQSSWYTSAYAEVPMISAKVDELVIFKAKNTASKKKILSAVKKYQAGLKEDTLQYPMNRLKIQGSKVYTKGKYVCFFMLGQISSSQEESDSVEEIIKAYQKQNQKAVNAVKKKLK